MIKYEIIAKQTKLMRNAQIVMVCMLSYAMFLAGFQNLLAVFISYTPRFRLTTFVIKSFFFAIVYEYLSTLYFLIYNNKSKQSF